MISREEIEKLSSFSKLKFNEEEIDILKDKLEESLEFVKAIKEVDTKGVEPLYRVFEYEEKFREDIVNEEEALTRDEVLSNTAEKQYGYFKLLNIMD